MRTATMVEKPPQTAHTARPKSSSAFKSLKKIPAAKAPQGDRPEAKAAMQAK